MAQFLDQYEFTTYLNDREVDLDPSGFSFSMADSIYSLYSYLTMSVDDVDGALQEYFGVVEGNKITLGFGTQNQQINTCPYAIRKNELQDPRVPGTLAGIIDVEGVHYWRHLQQVRSRAYKNTISAIVSRLAQGQHFSAIEIEDTGNNDYWYQMMETDGKFISNTLLPNAFSSGSNSPFYAYITSNNVFHLKSLNSMLNTSNIEEIHYKAINSMTDISNYTINIRRWSQPSEEHFDLLHRRVFTISSTDGSLIEEDDSIGSYPPKANRAVPIANFGNQFTGYYNVGFSESDTGPKENLRGQRINSTKKSAFIERYMLLLPFNPKLLSGNPIQLNMYESSASDTLLRNASGRYIIENSEHIWDNENHKANTKIIVGRKYTGVIPASYLMEQRLI